MQRKKPYATSFHIQSGTDISYLTTVLFTCRLLSLV